MTSMHPVTQTKPVRTPARTHSGVYTLRQLLQVLVSEEKDTIQEQS